MTGTLSETTEGIPEFPMKRAAGCPFDPPPELMAKQHEGPLVRVRLWDGSTPWLVTRHADQRAVLADRRVSADPNKPGYPSQAPLRQDSDEDGDSSTRIGFILMDDPEHARLRRMVTAPFMVKRIAAMRPAVQRIVDDLIDDLLAGPKPVDLVQAFALPVPSLVICELLGVPYDDHAFFQDNSGKLVSRSVPVEEREAASRALGTYLHDLIGRKMTDPGDDLLSGLTERIDAGELTQRQAAGIGVLLLLAGHETTANMIALGTATLLQHPDQLALLREAGDSGDDALVASAVEELLRYLNITHGGRRRVAVEDLEVGGQLVRAGEGLIVANDIGNRDPEVFDDPNRLDVSRGARNHVAFGFGVHQCLGQPLARLELQIVYGTLYRRIPTLRLAGDLDEIPFKHDSSVYGVYELPVTW